jgi:NADPH-dependent 7-cyano-7-deazaguanine reductase QueF
VSRRSRSLQTIRIDANVKVALRAEFTAVCPVSETVDIYEIEVEYEGKGEYIELESFKRYLESFRDAKIYHEQLCERIWRDVKYALGENTPVRVKLTSRYLGITVTVEKGEGTQP